MTSAPTLPWDAGLRLLQNAARSWVEMFRGKTDTFTGTRVASVPVTIGGATSGTTNAQGTLSLLRQADGTHRLGVEVKGSVLGSLLPGAHRWTFSLDDVLDVRWEPSFWAGTLVVTPLDTGGLRRVPGRPQGAAHFRVSRRDRGAAEAFARSVALADLPA